MNNNENTTIDYTAGRKYPHLYINVIAMFDISDDLPRYIITMKSQIAT